MKTSNKIIIICLLFIIGGIVYDKYQIKQAYDTMTFTEKEVSSKNYIKFDHAQPFYFKHVYIDGMNVGFLNIRNKDNFHGIKYTEDLGEMFDRYVKNDTLYIKYHEQYNRTNLFTNGLSRVPVFTNQLQSVTVKNARVHIALENNPKLSIKALYSADVTMRSHNVDSLFTHVSSYSKISVNSLKKRKASFASAYAEKNGVITFRSLKVNQISVTKRDTGRFFAPRKPVSNNW